VDIPAVAPRCEDAPHFSLLFESGETMREQSRTGACLSRLVLSILFVAAMLGHIYIGTIGMEGAFEAMGEGTVDVNWAKEHHRLWLEDEMGRSSTKGARAQPAE